jgi:hypothetical protein
MLKYTPRRQRNTVNKGDAMPNHAKRQPTNRARAIAALDDRLKGHTYRTIAQNHGYRDASGAYRAINRLLDRKETESVTTLRRVETERLDTAQAAVWPKVQRGDLGAIREFVRISERRCRLLGLDMPVQVAVGISEQEFAARAAELLEIVGDKPLRELVRAGQEPEPAEPLPEDTQPWGNIGPQDGYAAGRGWDETVIENQTVTAFEEPEVVDAEIVDDDEEPLTPDNGCCGEPATVYETRVPFALVAAQKYDPFRGWRR